MCCTRRRIRYKSFVSVSPPKTCNFNETSGNSAEKTWLSPEYVTHTCTENNSNYFTFSGVQRSQFILPENTDYVNSKSYTRALRQIQIAYDTDWNQNLPKLKSYCKKKNKTSPTHTVNECVVKVVYHRRGREATINNINMHTLQIHTNKVATRLHKRLL